MERFLLEHVQHIPLLLPFLGWHDVESLSSATRGLSCSVLRDVFLRNALVVVPKCPLTNAVVRGTLAGLSPLARHVAIAEPSHLALLRRLPLLSMLRVAPSYDVDQDEEDPASLHLGREEIAWLCSLSGVVQLELDAHVDDLAALLGGMLRLQALSLVVRSRIATLDPLGNLHNLQSLSLCCGSIGDLHAIGALARLESLALSSWAVHDISAIGRLVRLERLDLSRCNVVDLSPIANLRSLRSLKLEETPIGDLWPLAHLIRLEDLSLARSQVSDLSPLGARAASLQYLDLSGCTLARVSAVCSLQELECLRVHKTIWSNLDDEPSVSVAISRLQKLRVVDGRVTTMLSLRPNGGHTRLELATLQHLQRLEYLELSGDSLSGSTPPVPLPHLMWLRVEWNYAREPDVPLAAVVHPRLRVLTLVRMHLRSLHNLQYAPLLVELRLVDVLMEDLSSLRTAVNLTHFEHSCAMVRGNEVADDDLPRGRPPTLDLAPLGDLTKLEYLNLSFSSIRNLQPLRALTKLRYLDLSNTDVEDVSPLCALPLLECIRLRDTEISGFEGGEFCRVLRELVLPEQVDCRSIREAALQLRRLLHPDRNCLWAGHTPHRL